MRGALAEYRCLLGSRYQFAKHERHMRVARQFVGFALVQDGRLSREVRAASVPVNLRFGASSLPSSATLHVSKFLLTNEVLIAIFSAAGIRERSQSTYEFVNRFNPDLPIKVCRDSGRLSVEAGFEDHPVVGISWLGAALAAHLVRGRLPLVAEWRQFAAAPLAARYPWGEEMNEDLANVAQVVGGTTPVGTYPPHNGLFDLIGNAEEWCLDWYEAGAPIGTVSQPRYSEKAVVAGSWSTPLAQTGIAVCRGKWYRIGTRSIGCRIVWDESPEVSCDHFCNL